MTTKKYVILMLLTCAVVYGVHFILLVQRVAHFNWIHFNVLDGIIFLLFVVGGAAVMQGVKKSPENFVLRFMSLTTFQLLAILSIIAAVIYSDVHQARHVVFNIMGVFVCLLAAQSFFLVSALNQKK